MNEIKRVLIKISGEALEDKVNHEAYDPNVLNSIAHAISEIRKQNVDVCIVVGGGNIFRGKEAKKNGIDKIDGDYMGMLSTVINGIALKNILKNHGLLSHVFSAFKVDKCVDDYSITKARKHLDKGEVLIFVGGIGHPYFTTDTCSSLRAKEMNCDAILMAKNGVDGVFDCDPKTNQNAKFISNMTYQDIIEKNLQVMDLTSAGLLIDSKIRTYVFNIDNPLNALKIIKGEKIGTLIED